MRTAFPDKVDAPSVSVADGTHLYMRGPLEGEFRENLGKPMVELLAGEEGAPAEGGTRRQR